MYQVAPHRMSPSILTMTDGSMPVASDAYAVLNDVASFGASFVSFSINTSNGWWRSGHSKSLAHDAIV